jgi:hypothetical protein
VEMAPVCAMSRCRCGRGEPSPGADVAGVSPVPVQMWQGVRPVPVQMWQGLEERKPFFAFLSPLTSRSRASFVLTRAPSLYRCVAVTLFRLLIESVMLVGVSPRLSNVYCPRSRWQVASETWILPRRSRSGRSGIGSPREWS